VFHKIYSIALFIVLVLPGHASARSDFAHQLLRRMPELLAKYHVPGAEIAYIHDGEVVWTRAYGTVNVHTSEPMRPGLVFNFGSCGKVLTAWGIMRLVEQGKIDLNGPANRYLKRYQIQSNQFDPNGVTIRRLLSHTAGLTIHGFSDYAQDETLPSLVQMLNGENQSDGMVYLKWQPGSQIQYSGGGFVILQMVIEDVTGESFADFMQREVTNPLGMTSLHWTWTPESIQRAAIPFDNKNQPVGYRQLACQAIGSEVGTVNDFARFIAAAVEGPNGEPVGRGVLKPETIHRMLQAQPNTRGNAGLGYGLQSVLGEPIALHIGGNPGWSALFFLDLLRREGLVFASNSSNAFPLGDAVGMLWFQTVLSPRLMARVGIGLSGLFGLALLLSLVWLTLAVRSGKRARFIFKPRRIFMVLPWVILALLWAVVFYTSLLLPFSFPDAWPPEVHVSMAVFLAWVFFSLVLMFLPIRNRPSE